MNRLFSDIVDGLNMGVLLIDPNHKVLVWNNWLERVSGVPKNEAIGQKIGEVCPRFNEHSLRGLLDAAILNGQSRFCSGMLHNAFVYQKETQDIKEANRQNMQIEALHRDDEVFALIQINDITGQYRRIRSLQNLVKELEVDYELVKESEEHARRDALYDHLTGLCNRTLFYDRLSQALDGAKRNCHLAALLFLDVDGFKAVNDTYGHANGDKVLKEVAARLKTAVRKTDTVSRLGGDEYTVVLPDAKSRKNIESIAKKIITVFHSPFEFDSEQTSLTVSIGISVFPEDSGDPGTLLKTADSAMYSVKSSGKNGYKFFGK
ncbi:MAG: diguanylate cyclase [Negativicutes bacterium]|nr:diguanylate cyclase [Negativicutes bacterium]